MDTIFALSSGGVPSAIAVFRISGPQCRFVFETMTGTPPEPHRAALRPIRGRNGEVIDRGVVLWMPGPGSFTGEDSAEFQVHGSRAVVAALSRELGGFEGVRPAEAGEFTRRALSNGRMDLTEVEGLADLLAAETEEQRRQAVAQSSGALRSLYEGWRGRIVRIRALIEADFDFAEEEDIPGSVSDVAWTEAASLRAEMEDHLAKGERGERLRLGLQVVLLGAPNAGKSSLLNALARRDVAIVTEEAGTTRDLIEVHLDIAGFPVTIVDTAGLREGGGRIEREGMRRALARSEQADLVLWLIEPEGECAAAPPEIAGDQEIWPILSKADLLPAPTGSRHPLGGGGLRVSAASGAGIEELLTKLGDLAKERCGFEKGIGPTRERHRSGVAEALAALCAGLDGRGLPEEVRAEELRRAGDALGRITGRIGVEDLLDVVFREFCVGK